MDGAFFARATRTLPVSAVEGIDWGAEDISAFLRLGGD